MAGAAPLTLQLAERFERVPTKDLVASSTNPRKHFDPLYLDELARSIREHGLLQPIVAREKGKKFEIVMGECRWRAAVIADHLVVPCVIRPYTDEQALEVQLIENIHRTDLTPLEQAAGYRALIDSNPDKHSAAAIATRIGMSLTWVWDTLSLNALIPEAKTLLEEERITRGHAVLIARQKVEDQKAIIDPHGNRTNGYGLWRDDHGLELGERSTMSKADKYDGLKACSIRELDHWITHHIRFDVDHAAKAQPLRFEETKTLVDLASRNASTTKTKGPVAITYDFRVADDARDEDGERTYGRDAWQRADGKEKSKTCDYGVLGVVVAGHGQGETLHVCVNRDKCAVHFGKVIKERAKNQQLRDTGQAKSAASREAAAEQRRKRENERAAEAQARWSEIGGRIDTEIDAALKKLKVVTPALLALALEALNLPAKTKVADLPRMLVEKSVEDVNFEWAYAEKDVRAWAKAFGIDVAAIEKAVDAEDAKASAKKKVS